MKLVLNESHIPYQAKALNPSMQSQGDWKETKSFYIGLEFSETSGDQKNRFYEPVALKRFFHSTMASQASSLQAMFDMSIMIKHRKSSYKCKEAMLNLIGLYFQVFLEHALVLQLRKRENKSMQL
ncbi:uncharacterized protein LOC131874462 [Cryptomeria japonica]|uniref:uncharacterized protein LOC131874462 n=1 Tax=Cryptomeria japonica TaxID=3369 RepID=UPI0027D9F893|nr:uncharacterized protein LOC131874462 [Cryptomeria japonica]